MAELAEALFRHAEKATAQQMPNEDKFEDDCVSHSRQILGVASLTEDHLQRVPVPG